MNVLIVGGGGREHALAWKLHQSPKIENIFVAPGNAGTAQIATNVGATSTQEIVTWLTRHPVDLVVVGPDEHLALGLVDTLQEMNIPVFGPTKAAAEIEWSKSFAKQFMKEEGIPTAAYEIFTDLKKAKAYVELQRFPIVIKASGLAFGKGVVIANSLTQAEEALEEIMESKVFGKAGDEVVIEEYLQGKEISVHAFCDGENVAMFPSSQDHKRIFENDEGPNTGGMGTIAPLPSVTQAQMDEIKNTIVIPTIQGLQKRGRTFRGVLYPGIIFTEHGPKVIEFNARFGDPEAQSYMRLLESDLLDIFFACIHGTLDTQEVHWSSQTACCIVCASEGYPHSYDTGKKISGLDVQKDSVIVFHAGTSCTQKDVVTSGGRVLGVSAVGNTLPHALKAAYDALEHISFEGIHYRKDIGVKSLMELPDDAFNL